MLEKEDFFVAFVSDFLVIYFRSFHFQNIQISYILNRLKDVLKAIKRNLYA